MAGAKGTGKGVVETVLAKEKQDGGTRYAIIIADAEGNAVEYWDSKGSFKDKKGQEVEFEWQKSDDGKITFINPVGGSKGGGRSYGKSPEELALQRRGFAMAYAKDQVNDIMKAYAHLQTKLPVIDGNEVKQLDVVLAASKIATTETIAKAEEFLKWITKS